jgi:hypothetical protein
MRSARKTDDEEDVRVPAQPDHRFRRKLITDSGPS